MNNKIKLKHELNSEDSITQLVIEEGIKTWEDLLDYVKKLPYGRNLNRVDFSLVMIEKKGTCSSKHAFLKKIADLNDIENVGLVLGIYKMTQKNTPGIGNTLKGTGLEHIPEAHCYLNINGTRIDCTTIHSNFTTISNDILTEKSIMPDQVGSFKIEYHKDFLKQWLSENELQIGFNDLWKIREDCIAELSKANEVTNV